MAAKVAMSPTFSLQSTTLPVPAAEFILAGVSRRNCDV
jgi:hypothetical protein